MSRVSRQPLAVDAHAAPVRQPWTQEILAFLPRRSYARIAAPEALRVALASRFPSSTVTPLSAIGHSRAAFDLIVIAEDMGRSLDPHLPLDRHVPALAAGGVLLHDRLFLPGLPGGAADLIDRVIYDHEGETRLVEVRIADGLAASPLPAPTGTVAAIIPNYNYGAFLREAIQSLEEQTRPPDEVIIIDDASTDDSRDVFPELEARGYRVVRNAVNLGIVENFRKAVSLTRSDFIFFLGADNRLRPDYVARSAAALESDPDCAVAYSDMLVFGPMSNRFAEKVGGTWLGHAIAENWDVFRWRLPDPTPETLKQFAKHNFVGGSSMFRRVAYDAVGGYQPSAGPEDHDLFHRMWQAGGGLRRIDGCLVEYRQHSPSQANTVLGLMLTNRALQEARTAGATAVNALRAEVKALTAEADALRRERDALREAHTANLARDEERASHEAFEAHAQLASEIESARLAEERARVAAQFAEIAALTREIEASTIWPVLKRARSTRRRLSAIRARAEGKKPG